MACEDGEGWRVLCEGVRRRATYEEACEFQAKFWSFDNVRNASSSGLPGMQALAEELRSRLADLGWSPDELFQEACLRVRQRVETMKKEEASPLGRKRVEMLLVSVSARKELTQVERDTAVELCRVWIARLEQEEQSGGV